MSKIVRNTSGSDILVTDTGITVAASSSYTIPPQDYPLWAASSNAITYVGAGTLVVNDGTSDLSIANGTALLQGSFPSTVKAQLQDDGGLSLQSLGNRLKVMTEGAALLADDFDGASVDTNQWTAATASGGSLAVTASALVLTTSTTASASAALTSIPTFANQGISYLIHRTILKFETALLAHTSRFWGRGSVSGGALYDGIGFEVDTTGALNACVYAAGTRVFSQALTAPTDGNWHSYTCAARSDTIYWYIDSMATTVATATFKLPNSNTLPILIRMANGATPPSSAPTFQVMATNLADSSATNIALVDGTYPWKKANVSGTGITTALPSANTFVTGMYALTTRSETDIPGATHTVASGKAFTLTDFIASYDAQASVYVRLKKQTGGVGSFVTQLQINLEIGGQGQSTIPLSFAAGIGLGSSGDVFKLTVETNIVRGNVWAMFSGIEA